MLVSEGFAASIGIIGDAYDNALAESTTGLSKSEAVFKSSPFLQGLIKTVDDIEFATMEWVDWFNTRHLHSTVDYVTPDEFEPFVTVNYRFSSRRCRRHRSVKKPGTFTVPREK